jgi:hypothetical protein
MHLPENEATCSNDHIFLAIFDPEEKIYINGDRQH